MSSIFNTITGNMESDAINSGFFFTKKLTDMEYRILRIIRDE